MERRYFLNGLIALVAALICAAAYLMPSGSRITHPNLYVVVQGACLVAFICNLLVFWRDIRTSFAVLDERLTRTDQRFFIRRV